MNALVRVTDVAYLGSRVLRVTFSDGLVRDLDFSTVLVGALSALDDDQAFAAATVDPIAGTVSWPNDIDLDPDVLHGDHPSADGRTPIVVREHRH